MSEKYLTLPSLVKRWAEEKSNKKVFTFVNPHRRLSAWTPRDLYVLGRRFASRLLQSGFQKGDVLANTLPNSPERLITDIGINMAGCVVLNCMVVENDGSDFWHTAMVSECKGTVCIDDHTQPPYSLLEDFIHEPTEKDQLCLDVSAPRAPRLKHVILIGRGTSGKVNQSVGNDVREGSFLESLMQDSDPGTFVDCSPSDVAYIFTTSGTTGWSKIILRTHEELAKASCLTELSSFRGFNNRPLGWGSGFPYDLYGHCSGRILQDMFEGDVSNNVMDIWSIIQSENCDAAVLAPEEVTSLVEAFKDNPPTKKLECLSLTGQPIKKRHTAALGVLANSLVIAYACTEAGLISICTITDPDQFEDCFCGRPMSFVSVKVVDENMKEVPLGTKGSVLVKSSTMKINYHNPGIESSTSFTDDGYFMTGDRGVITERGDLYVYGRDGAAIQRGMTLVYVSWLETIIGKCPGVNDVVVIALKSEDSDDDKMCVCVLPQKEANLKETDVREFYTANFLPEQPTFGKVIPTLNYVMFYSEFPVSPNGKIDLRKLKKDAYETFGNDQRHENQLPQPWHRQLHFDI